MVRQAQLDRDGRLRARFRPGKWQLPDRISGHICDDGKRPVLQPREAFDPPLFNGH
jgi:hypothetical protein